MKKNILLFALCINFILMNGQEDNREFTTLGAGCFWCVEAIFEELEGVYSVEAGYTGGHTENPTYEEVCSKNTGHVEVARIEFNSKIISFEKILDVFWKTHDPTSWDKQGNDKGPQYRSAIFYHNEEQKIAAEKSKEKASAWFTEPIVTEIRTLERYYVAENYHQNYFKRVGNQNPYCSYVIAPKVNKFKKEFKDLLKK